MAIGAWFFGALALAIVSLVWHRHDVVAVSGIAAGALLALTSLRRERPRA